MNAYDVFTNFYYALDYIFDLTKSTELGDYLSGANPFLFAEEGSADPAVYDEFEKAFCAEFGTKTVNAESAYNWINKYVDILKNDAVKNAFKKITLQMWIEAVE
jgi:hypothetical protein